MSIKVPMEVVKGVFVPLDNLYYLVDFIVFNIESNKKKKKKWMLSLSS